MPDVERDPDQAWFWVPAWAAGEAEADEDLRLGQYERVQGEGQLLRALDR